MEMWVAHALLHSNMAQLIRKSTLRFRYSQTNAVSLIEFLQQPQV